MLSKSRFTRGFNCPKSLWLYVYKRDKQVIPEMTQILFARGKNVGELARQYFPDGRLAVSEKELPGYTSVKRTQEFIKQGIETIYEATFIFHNTLVAIDILHNQNGKWQIYEVKSTNSIKPEHIKDTAIQYYVAKGNGHQIDDVFLMHFNKEYVRKGDIDVKKLFLPESILKEVLMLQEEIKVKIHELLAVLKGNEPSISMGKQCEKPYFCDFYDYCLKQQPSFINEKTPFNLKPEIQAEGLKNFLDELKFPLYFLDIETFMPGVPMFDESRPYQQIAFQYSLLHQQEKNSEPKHELFLSENNPTVDPRKELIKKLIEQTKPAKTILLLSTVLPLLKEMQRDFPHYTDELQSIIDKTKELHITFNNDHFNSETINKISYFKQFLSRLCSECTSNVIDKDDDLPAGSIFMDLYSCQDEEILKQTHEKLVKYCHTKTFIMTKILESIKIEFFK